jgi:mRNA interferase MazF
MTKHKVVLVPFPFDDLSSSKVRPAVCLTNPIGSHRHVILAFITRHVAPSPLATDLIIDASDRDFAATGLHVSSTLQLHRLMTVTTALIKRELGQLSPKMATEVDNRLRRLFDNALESFFGRLKTNQRRITGRKSVNSFVLRYGSYAPFVDPVESKADVLTRLSQVDRATYQLQRQHLQRILVERQAYYRFCHKLDTVVQELELEWQAAVDADTPRLNLKTHLNLP